MRVLAVQPGPVLLTPSGPLKKRVCRLSVLAPLLMLVLGAGLCRPAVGQKSNPPDQRPSVQPNTPQLNADQVVQNLVRMNMERAEALQAYQSTRVYRLEYKGFPGGREAEMVVNVKYRAPGTKEFEIVSETGSKLLIDRVFKKLLQGEQEALEVESQKRIAINQDNYEFTMIGYEAGSYVLTVKPRTKNKFLFQGRIWVDAEHFAVVRIAVEPAQKPSFWIKDTKIETLYVNVNDFWLPAHNHSLTAVRLGGHADFTIEYKDYRITAARQPNRISSNAGPGR
ncbi:MAG TPA: hypothetical protein VJ723_00690 [Candidatus Angelobacter sp.]|nr:hypothetical protein [Candidatus Angelobacter sp.]